MIYMYVMNYMLHGVQEPRKTIHYLWWLIIALFIGGSNPGVPWPRGKQDKVFSNDFPPWDMFKKLSPHVPRKSVGKLYFWRHYTDLSWILLKIKKVLERNYFGTYVRKCCKSYMLFSKFLCLKCLLLVYWIGRKWW